MHYLKIINTFWKIIEDILKQIVWETQNAYIFSRPSGSWNIDQNMQNIVLINNSRTTWPTKILMPFLKFSDILLWDAYIIVYYSSIIIIIKKGVDNFQIALNTC